MNVYKIKYLKYKKKYLILQKGGVNKCPRCTFINKDTAVLCEVCKSSLPAKSSGQAAEETVGKICSACTYNNENTALECVICDSPLLTHQPDSRAAEEPPKQAEETCPTGILVSNYLKTIFPGALEASQGPTYNLWTKIEKIFHEEEWTIFSPRGDGKCLLYSIFQSLELQITDLFDFLADRLINYFKIIGDIDELSFLTSKDKLVNISRSDTKEIVKDKLIILLNDDNLSELFIEVLSKSMGLNILLLMYDSKTKKKEEEQHYFQNYYDSTSTDPKYLILLNTQGHYMSVFPAGNPAMKQSKIEEIKDGKLWQIEK
jgi:hypothetical protein